MKVDLKLLLMLSLAGLKVGLELLSITPMVIEGIVELLAQSLLLGVTVQHFPQRCCLLKTRGNGT